MTVAEGGAGAERPRLLRFLPRFLFVAEHVPAYIARAWLLALLPSFLLSSLVYAVAPAAEVPLGDYKQVPFAVTAFMLVLVAPFLESLIMAGVAALLHRAFGFTAAAVGSSLAWGIAHSAAVPVWGLVVWWPFLILTIVYLTWRRRGFWVAIGMATAVHGLQNGVAAVALLLG